MFVQATLAHEITRRIFKRCMTRGKSMGLLIASIAFCAASAHATTLSNTPDRTYVVDADVNAISRVGNTIYIGGNFTRVGPRTGPGAEVALDGTWNATLPEVSGAGPSTSGGAATGLRAVIADGTGGWYIGGLFTHVGGGTHTNVAHILADHSVDPAFHPSINGNVEALALSGSTLYVAGLFTSIDGQPRNNIAGLDAVNGAVTAFNPNADAEVAALAVSTDGLLVYAGGHGFTSIGGQARTSLAALDATTGTANAAFNPILAMANGAPTVDALAISGPTLYAAGNFDSINGTVRRTIAALNANGTVVTSFAPAPTYFGCVPCATVVALAVSGSTVYVGGSFDTIGTASRNNIAGLSTADGTATAFNPQSSGNILSLAASGSVVYAGGGFYMIGGQPRNFAAALNATDGSALAFDPNPNGSIGAIAVSGSAIYLGGLFSSLGGVPRAGLAAIDATTGMPTAWNPAAAGMNGNLALVSTMVTTNSTLYAAGAFVTIGGQSRQNIAEVNLSDGLATAWNPTSDGGVDTLALSGSVMYAGGSFIHIGGQQRIFIAALDLVSGAATAWDPSADNTVQAIAVAGNVVYAGGMFLHIGGQERLALAAIDASTGTATAWTPNPGGGIFGAYVYTLAVDGPRLFVGGGFDSMQGVARHNAAALSLADATPTAFDPQTSGGGDDGAVSTIAVDGATVYLGGSFDTVGGQPRALLAATSAVDGSALAFNPNGSGGQSVHELNVAADGTLYVGGSFPTFDLAYQQGFASFSPAAPSDVIFADGFEGM
jgi:hypothetical protein